MATDLENRLYEAIKASLTEVRPANDQTLTSIADTYSYTEERLEQFMTEKLNDLELYELDIVFSPQFTPKTEDQVRFVALLDKEAISEDQVKQLIQRLDHESLSTALKLRSGEEVILPLHEVFIDRYVSRLRLDKPLAKPLVGVYDQLPDSLKPHANLLFRDDSLKKAHKAEIVERLLQQDTADWTPDRLFFLVDTLRTYRPQSMEDLVRQLDALIKSCEEDSVKAQERSYHNEELKHQHSGNVKDLHQAKDIQEHYANIMKDAEWLKPKAQNLLTTA